MAPKLPQQKKLRFNMSYVFIALFGVMLLHEAYTRYSAIVPIPYSEFQKLLAEKKVSDLVISDQHIQGRLTDPVNNRKEFITIRVEGDLAKDLSEKGVTYTRIVENTFIRDLLSWIVPVLFFFGIWMLLSRRMPGGGGFGGGLMSIGKSKAKVYVETDIKVTFDDVAGVDEAKAELKEIVDFLKAPKDYGRLGGRMPKGVLLIGPPGTGKTLVAKAVAGEAAVPFFSISGSEFVEMFVGVGAARVRDLFEQARAKAPCIIFIDELDALGRARTASPLSGGHDEKEQTLNQLLVEMDGFDSSVGIIILSATNRPEILDPALLRAGRFDRQVLVDKPDKKGREAILKVHIKKVQLAEGVDLEKIAALTPGFTGADLANLVNEAALVATRRKAEKVGLDDFTAAIERIIAGLEKKNRILSEDERRIVAHHEMGHAIVAAALPKTDPVHKVSIIPRGIGALGYTIQRPTEDRYLMTRIELENKLAVLLGGRAAEKVIFNHLSTGASDDLSKATDIARSMATRFGMETELGNVTYENDTSSFLGPGLGAIREKLYSEETAREIDCAVRKIVDGAYNQAVHLLTKHKDVLVESAQTLLAKETLTEVELAPFFAKVRELPSA